MNDLVKQLITEHKLLVEILNEVKSLGISSPKAQAKMISAKNGLLDHLKKEDELLYPKLYMASIDDGAIKSTLDMFKKDMDAISKEALAFFIKYEHGGAELEFARDFGKLSAALSTRIRREEQSLYPLFSKL